MLKLHSLRIRLIALISLLAIAICGTLAAFFLPQQSRLVDTALEREMQAQYASVIAAIDYERKSALALSTFASNLPDVQAAFAAGDRDRLVATLGTSLRSISAGFGYNLMTMTRPPATVYLRIHQPEVHGDDSAGRRKMVVSVNQEGTTQSGIERGLTSLSIFGTVPLMHEGRQLGAFDVGMEFGKAFVETVKARFGVDIAVHVQDGEAFKTLISTLADASVGTPSELRAGQDGTAAVRRTAIGGTPVAAYFGPLKNFSGQSIGAIEIVKSITDLEAIGTETRTAIIVVAAGVLVVAFGLALLLAVSLSRPIVDITATMTALSNGDMSATVPGVGRKDEIGAMAAAVHVFKDKMAESDRLRGQQESLKQTADAEKKALARKMADEFEVSVKSIVESVASTANRMKTSAQSMANTADEAACQSSAVAAAAEQASTNVGTVAAAAEELSSSIAEIGHQVGESTRIAGQAVEDAKRTNDQIQALAQAAQKIGEVVSLINHIAGQTNLLALNATIEASRAGEAGKGFAVVASEVKALASQTARATDDIAAQVNAIQGATGGAVQAIQTIGQTIARLNDISVTIASAVEEQGAATQEIARNVQQASAGTGEVSSNIMGVTKAAGETGSAASLVLDAASDVATRSETLNTEVDVFVARIRAA